MLCDDVAVTSGVISSAVMTEVWEGVLWWVVVWWVRCDKWWVRCGKRRGGMRKQRRVPSEKQEPHTVMWGITINRYIMNKWINWPEVKEVKKWQDVFWEYSLDSIHNRYCFNMIPIIHVHYYYYRTSVIYDPYVISSVLFIMMINLDWENILCNILAWGYLELTIIRSEVLRGLLKMILWLRK